MLQVIYFTQLQTVLTKCQRNRYDAKARQLSPRNIDDRNSTRFSTDSQPLLLVVVAGGRRCYTMKYEWFLVPTSQFPVVCIGRVMKAT